MTSKEKIENAWELVNSKHIETNDEIQLVRFAVRTARDLVERDTPMLPIKLKWKNTENYYYVCPKCEEMVARNDEVFCQDCGQRLDWNFDFLETLKEK